MDLNEITRRLSDIKASGWVKTQRNGPTGIGHTLERLLCLEENNISLPDLGEIELKAQRENHSGLTTLFTFNRGAWKMKPHDAVSKYGTTDEKGRLGLYYGITKSTNRAGLYLLINDDHLSVKHTDGNLIVQWALDDIVDKFNQKVSSLLLVKAKSEYRDGVEYFKFCRAQLLTGGVNKANIKMHLETEDLVIELRLHETTGAARNHGTAFRINESKLEQVYTQVRSIDF